MEVLLNSRKDNGLCKFRGLPAEFRPGPLLIPYIPEETESAKDSQVIHFFLAHPESPLSNSSRDPDLRLKLFRPNLPQHSCLQLRRQKFAFHPQPLGDVGFDVNGLPLFFI